MSYLSYDLLKALDLTSDDVWKLKKLLREHHSATAPPSGIACECWCGYRTVGGSAPCRVIMRLVELAEDAVRDWPGCEDGRSYE